MVKEYNNTSYKCLRWWLSWIPRWPLQCLAIFMGLAIWDRTEIMILNLGFKGLAVMGKDNECLK